MAAGGGLLAVALAAALAGTGQRLALLLLIGVACGVTLSHASFGFTSAYRQLLFARDASGIKAQLAMLE